MLILPATAETIAGFIAAAEAAPDELSTIANVMPAPPMPFLAPEHHGRLVVMALLAHVGDARGRPAGGRAVPRPRRRRSPTWSGRCPTRRSTRPTTPTTTRWPWPGRMFMDRIGRDEAAAILAAPRGVGRRRCGWPSSACSAGRWPASRPTPRPSPTARAGSWSIVAAFHDGTPEDRARRQAWVEELAADAAPGRRRRLRQLPRRRGRGARPGGLPRRDVGSAGGRQAPLRPDEPLPPATRTSRRAATGPDPSRPADRARLRLPRRTAGPATRPRRRLRHRPRASPRGRAPRGAGPW